MSSCDDCGAMMAVSILGWLAEHCARVRFSNSDKVAGMPADQVTVEAAGSKATCPTLVEAIMKLKELGL